MTIEDEENREWWAGGGKRCHNLLSCWAGTTHQASWGRGPASCQTCKQTSSWVIWSHGEGVTAQMDRHRAPSMQMHPNASATNSHCKSNWFNGYTGCLNYTKHLKNKTTTCREKSMMHKIWKWKLMFFHQIMKFELFIKAVLLCWRHKLLLFLTKHICTTAKLNFSL